MVSFQPHIHIGTCKSLLTLIDNNSDYKVTN